MEAPELVLRMVGLFGTAPVETKDTNYSSVCTAWHVHFQRVGACWTNQSRNMLFTLCQVSFLQFSRQMWLIPNELSATKKLPGVGAGSERASTEVQWGHRVARSELERRFSGVLTRYGLLLACLTELPSGDRNSRAEHCR